MSLIDDGIKWLTAPKTLKGIAGMIIIIAILAADFAMWAGRDLTGSVTGSRVDVVEEMEVPEDYDSGPITDSLPHGQNLVAFQQLIGDPRGQGEDETYKLYQFPILANITKLEIVSSGDGGGSRVDGGDRNDIDLYMYAPDNDPGGDQESTQPDYDSANPYIEESISLKNNSLDLGNWTLRVNCYTGQDVSYTIQIQIFYGGGKVAKEEGD